MFIVIREGSLWAIYDTVARVSYTVGKSKQAARIKCAQLNKP